MKSSKKQGIVKFKTMGEYYNFFNKVPDKKWTTGVFDNGEGQMCALGLLGASNYGDRDAAGFRNALAFEDVDVYKSGHERKVDASDINNGNYEATRELGNTPKERILNAIVLKESGIYDDVD